MGRCGWGSNALTDPKVIRTYGEPSCSLLQLEDLAGRSQQSGELRGGQRVKGSGCVWGGVSDAPLHVLSVHFIKQRRGVSGDGHGRALDHGAG